MILWSPVLLSLIPLKLTHMGRMKGKSLLVSGQSRRLGRDLEIFFAKRVESVRFESFSAEVAFSMFSGGCHQCHSSVGGACILSLAATRANRVTQNT